MSIASGGGASSSARIMRLFPCTRASEDDWLDAEMAKQIRRSTRRAALRRKAVSGDEGEETDVDDPEATDLDEVANDEEETVKELPVNAVKRQAQLKQQRRKKTKQLLERTPSMLQEDQVSHSKDSFWQKLFGSGGGDNTGERKNCRDGSSSQLVQRAKSPYVGSRRKRRKRLVVAMLEDDDGATADGRSSLATTVGTATTATTARGAESNGSGGMRVQATRDEKSIRRILQKLSDTLNQPPEQRHRPEDTAASTLLKQQETAPPTLAEASLHATATAALQPPQFCGDSKLIAQPQQHSLAHQPTQLQAQQPVQLHPLSVASRGTALQPHTVPPLPPSVPPQSPPALPPRTTAGNASVQPPAVPSQPAQQPAPPLPQLPTPSALPSVVAQSLSAAPAEETHENLGTELPRNAGRRGQGYRMFHRIFSPTYNYYAVPFPPLENLKFKEDEDGQWEDLEIYVASHKGLVALKPQQKLQNHSEKQRILKGVTRSNPGNRQLPLQAKQRMQQSECQIFSDGRRVKSDQNNRPPRRFSGSSKPTQQHQQQQQQHQQQHQQLSQRATPVDPKMRFASLQQQSQVQKFERFHQTTERRAQPLNSGRLLSHLKSGSAGATNSSNRRASAIVSPAVANASVASTSGAGTGPLRSYMRPYTPQFQRARWTGGHICASGSAGDGACDGGNGSCTSGGGGGGGGGGARCGRLVGQLPAVTTEKSNRQGGCRGRISAL